MHPYDLSFPDKAFDGIRPMKSKNWYFRINFVEPGLAKLLASDNVTKDHKIHVILTIKISESQYSIILQ